MSFIHPKCNLTKNQQQLEYRCMRFFNNLPPSRDRCRRVEFDYRRDLSTMSKMFYIYVLCLENPSIFYRQTYTPHSYPWSKLVWDKMKFVDYKLEISKYTVWTSNSVHLKIIEKKLCYELEISDLCRHGSNKWFNFCIDFFPCFAGNYIILRFSNENSFKNFHNHYYRNISI